MDKYLLIILILLVMGMIFSIAKDFENPDLVMFYAQLAGALIIIVYSTVKDRRKRKSEKRS
ncbi:MAG: hypothetical protein ACREAX_04310 [Candidatus Nitrosotenuis sp.]